MNVLIAGASGLIGSAVVPAFTKAGHDVRRLVRRAARSRDEVGWNPAARELDPRHLEGVDAVVNLAGENIGGGRWSAARRERIRRSRIDATVTLVAAMTAAARPPTVLLNASAVGIYGDRGDEVLPEASAVGQGFLPEVCRAWEVEAEAAARAGIRTVRLRFGVVLAKDGGALARMLPLFRAGVGGRLGDGRQWMSWISREDVGAGIVFCAEHPGCSGAINMVAPRPVTNGEFTAALGRILRRPAVVPAPAWALRMAFGQMADEALLASTRAVPERLMEERFVFQHPMLEDALAAVLGKR